jgi:hypothetical protein
VDAVPPAHPRLHLTPETLRKLGPAMHAEHGADAPRLRALVATVRAATAALLEAPPPPAIAVSDEVHVPGAAAWEVRYLAEGETGFVRAREDGAGSCGP